MKKVKAHLMKKDAAEKTKVLKVKTDVKSGFCRYYYYAGDITGMQNCLARYGRW